MVPIPEHDFPEQFSNFCFNSLYIKEEVIKAMVEIRTICNDLVETCQVFKTDINRTIRLEEFKQEQNNAKGALQFSTKDQWIGNLEKIIKTSFSDVGKGWFNIHETSKETYEFGKLKKFLTVVNFMMQDSVLTLCQSSVKDFVEFMLKFKPESTAIISTHEVENVWKKDEEEIKEGEEGEGSDQKIEEEDENEDPFALTEQPDNPIPLFVLDLVLKPGQPLPQYSTDPHDIVKTVLQIMDDGLGALLEIPQLEPILLPKLFKTHGTKVLKAPHRPKTRPVVPDKKHILPDENTWLWNAYQEIKDMLIQSIKPLDEFIQTFNAFEAENQLNPDQYVSSLDDGETKKSVDAIKEDILKHREEEARLLDEIPESIIVSIFQVNCKDIRNLFSGKHTTIIEKEIKLIAQRARDTNNDLSLKFEDMQARIRKPPSTIEELTATKEYM